MIKYPFHVILSVAKNLYKVELLKYFNPFKILHFVQDDKWKDDKWKFNTPSYPVAMRDKKGCFSSSLLCQDTFYCVYQG